MIESDEQNLETAHSDNRRSFLKFLATIILLWPTRWVRAFDLVRPVAAFQSERFDETLNALFGDRALQPHDGIRIIAAELAENGAVVPVKIELNIERVESVAILATENPFPLVAKFDFLTSGTDFIATRIKLAVSCDIVIVVETQEGLYSARKPIEVTIGGCGG